jgi:hypothetical protein
MTVGELPLSYPSSLKWSTEKNITIKKDGGTTSGILFYDI